MPFAISKDKQIIICKNDEDIDREYEGRIDAAARKFLEMFALWERIPEKAAIAKEEFRAVYNEREGERYKYLEIVNGKPFGRSLQDAKDKKWYEIKKARDVAEQSGCDYNGKIFDSNLISATRINVACINALLSLINKTEFSIAWTLQDNTPVKLDAAAFLGLATALAIHSDNCHQRSRQLRQLIDAANTIDEVENISW